MKKINSDRSNTDNFCNTAWYKDNKLHREDSPAIVERWLESYFIEGIEVKSGFVLDVIKKRQYLRESKEAREELYDKDT